MQSATRKLKICHHPGTKLLRIRHHNDETFQSQVNLDLSNISTLLYALTTTP